MPYYYVQITYVSKLTRKPQTIGGYDMSKESVRKRIAEPYMSGQEFMFLGRRVDPYHIEVINIYETEDSVKSMAEERHISCDSIIDRIVLFQSIGTRVTTEFIKSLPPPKEAVAEKSKKMKGEKVFIVHGKDHKPMEELKAMLKEFGLGPIVLHEQPSGSRTIVEKLEKYSDVGYAFVILTPDDVGGPSKDRRTLRFEGKERARQNVVLEFGYFIGLLGRDRVCCLYKGEVELPSDMHGIVYISFKESVNEVRDKVVKELKAAGYKLES